MSQAFARLGPVRRQLLVFVIPGILVLALGVRAIEPTNGQDGYLYVGAVARMSDFLARFPDTYYGFRFGYILPAWVVRRVFGLEVGFYVVRFALLGAIAVVMGLRGAVRPASSLLATVIFTTAPIMLVATFNTYTLSLGVLEFVLGSLLLATTRELDRWGLARIFVAGAVLAMSWNSHLVVLPLCAVVFCVFLADIARGRRPGFVKELATSCAAFTAGTLSVVVAAVVIYGARFGVWDIYGPALSQANGQSDALYLESGLGWLSWRHYLLVGPLAVVAGVLVWRSEADEQRRSAIRRLTLFSGASLATFAIFQWFREDPLLQIYFYSAIPLVLSIATLALACALTADRDFKRASLVAFGVAIAVPTLTFTASRIRGPYGLVLAGSVIAIALAVFGARHPGVLRGLGIGGVLAASLWVSVSSPHDFPATPGGYRSDPLYDDALFAFDPSAMDKVKLVDHLASALPGLPDSRGQLSVWFEAGPLEQLAAPFVWYRSALQAPTDALPPTVSSTIIKRVQIERPRYIVVIDSQNDDASRGASVVMQLAPYNVVWQRTFVSGRLVAYVVLLERIAETWPDYPCGPKDHVPETCP